MPTGFSTFLGGSLAEGGHGVAVDAAGNTYIVAHTLSADIRVTSGTAPGWTNAYLAKLGPDGGLVWATMFGGSEGTWGNAVAVDGSGNVYITGSTNSADLPTTPGAYQQSYGGSTSAFVMKVDGATGAVIYSTYLSGNTTSGDALAVDATGNAYVAGYTRSTDFPTTPGALDTSANGNTDAFVAKLDPTGSALVYATYLGGGLDDYISAIAVDAAGNAYVTGQTDSANFPTTAGSFDPTANGFRDNFVAKLDPAGGSLLYSTYLGGGGNEERGGLTVDAAGNTYVTGATTSADFPTTAGAFDTTANGDWDPFVAKLNSAGDSLIYSTYLGGADDDRGYGPAVDAAGNAYVTGFTRSTAFPTTPDAFSTARGGDYDAFVTKLDPAGGALIYSTYLGGSLSDFAESIALDRGGNAYVAGSTRSTDFPTSAGAAQPAFAGGYSDIIATKLAIGVTPPAAAVTVDQAAGQADPTNTDSISFDVVFEAPVTGFDEIDVDLTASTVGGTLVAAVSGSGRTYTVTVTGMTGAGAVVATVPADAAVDGFGTPTLASTSTDNAVTFDELAPTVTINQAAGQADPATTGPVTFDVAFSEPVVGFDGSDIDFTGSTVGGTLAAVVTQTGPATYTVAVTGMTGPGTIVAGIPVGAAIDPAGNAVGASASTDNSVLFDGTAPTVTINRAPGQDDPTSRSEITFDVVFSEPVVGFDASDVSLAGSTAGGTLAATLSQTGPATYTVTVTGMTTRGTVVVSVPPGAAADAAGNPSEASTSTDNAVEFLRAGVVGVSTAAQTAAEGAVVTFTVSRTGGSEGDVSVNYTTVGGTARAASDFTAAAGTLSWAEGETDDKTFTVTITDDAANEGRELFAVALTDPTGGVQVGTPTLGMAIAPSNGAVIAGNSRTPKAVFADDAGLTGDLVTVTLGGKVGTATVYLTDPDGDGRGPIELVELAETDATRSTLKIGVKKPKGGTGDGRITLAEVSGTGLKGLTATTTDLIGTGIHLNGYLGSLKIGDVRADIVLNGPAPASLRNPSVKLTAGVIGDGADITVTAVPLGSLTAVAMGNGTITAPSAGTIILKGKPKTRTAPAIAGDFNADVVISGTGVAPTQPALKRLRVAGGITDAVITLGGNLGSVSVTGRVVGTTVDVAGNVGAVSVGSFWNSRLDAGYTGANNGSGTFDSPSAIGPFRVTAKAAGFQNSYVIAAVIKPVTLASVTEANGGTKFGFIARDSLAGLTVTAPAQRFRFDPMLTSPQTRPGWDFEATDLTGPAVGP